VPLWSSLAAVAGQVAEVAPEAVVLARDEGPEPPARPALTLTHEGAGVLHYLAVPEGPEKAPFVAAVLGPDDTATAPEAPADEPADLIVFMAAACPHCPHAVRAAIEQTWSAPSVTASIVDVQRFPELGEPFGARSVPLTVLDRGVAITGVVTASELAEAIRDRGSDAHEARLFRSLVETGRLAAAGVQLRARAEPFVAAWRDSTTTSRMGLLLVAEEVLGDDAAALDHVVPGLIPVLAAEDPALRGDTADLLGQIGHDAAERALTALCEDANAEVAEVAAEALEALRERG